jgi:DNA polymerase-1
MSISQPPLQQIPREGIKADGVTLDTRGCLIADPGHLLISADYSQIEQRVYATLAGEQDLIKAFIDGTDLHKIVATQLFGGSIEDVTSDQRQIAKTAGYLMIYGGGGRKLAISAGLPVPKAMSIVKAMKKAQRKGVSYARDLAELSVITTPFGRELPIDEARRYAALNYMVQSTARDLFVIGGVRIINAGYGQWLWLPIHDEWVLNVPEDQAERVAKELGEIMSIDFYGTPIIAEGVVLGKRWHKG